ncbi:MAG: tetratricopeptide repeat protein, partial [Methanotrichaceae archaeon]
MTLEDFPTDYAEIQNNLGVAYKNLSEVRDKNQNLEQAIRSYEEALKVTTQKENTATVLENVKESLPETKI